jgi:hypothetical protein
MTDRASGVEVAVPRRGSRLLNVEIDSGRLMLSVSLLWAIITISGIRKKDVSGFSYTMLSFWLYTENIPRRCIKIILARCLWICQHQLIEE